MKQQIKKLLPKAVLFLAITVILIIVLFSINDISAIGQELQKVSWPWLLGGIGFLVLYMIFNPIPLYILGNPSNEKNKISLKNSMLIGSTEYFFNGITPFSSGGQPFQVYSYTKIGVRPARSTGIMLMNFVSFQISVVIMCLYSLLFFEKLSGNAPHLVALVIVGLGMNILILGIFTAVGMSTHIAGLMIKLVKKICSWKIFKGKLDKASLKFESYCNNAQATFKELITHKTRFIFCIILKLLSLIFYYAIPFFILKALNLDVSGKEVPIIVAMTTLSVAMTCFIPTPGASGGIEFAFQSLFISLLPATLTSAEVSAVAASGMLLWRFITYYLLMIISFIIYLVFEKAAKMPPIVDDDFARNTNSENGNNLKQENKTTTNS